MQFYTYLYRDPKDETPIYVGKGSGMRAWSHSKKTTNPHLKNLLNKRKIEGYIVEPIIHNEVDETTALEMEKFWIAFYGRADLGLGTLFNLTDGGEGTSGIKRTPKTDEQKNEISLRFKNKPKTDEQKRKMSAARKGKPLTEETKINMSIVRKGRPWSESRRKAEEQRKT